MAARSLLGTTDKTKHNMPFLATEVAVYFNNNKTFTPKNIQRSKSFPAKVG